MGELAPAGPDLGRRNRRVVAERMGWPDGAVQLCEWIEAEFPDWHASWSDDGRYCAGRRDRHRHDPGPRYLYGATPEELMAAIEQATAVQRGLAEYRPLQLPEG